MTLKRYLLFASVTFVIVGLLLFRQYIMLEYVLTALVVGLCMYLVCLLLRLLKGAIHRLER